MATMAATLGAPPDRALPWVEQLWAF